MNKMTRQASILALAVIVSIPLGLAAQDEGFYPYSYARLSYVSGSVHVQRTSDLGYEQGEVNLALVQGDRLGTENGQAEVHFGRRNYLRVGDGTKVEFAVLPTEGDERIKVHLTEGQAYVRVSHLPLDKGIEIHTPDASFYVLEEGLYRFDVRPGGETRAQVREGSLEAASEDGSVLVRGQETVTAADGRLLGDPEYGYAREDGFDGWNGSRDAELAPRSERQYLPSELSEYEEELDRGGNWVYERPYGHVWVPSVAYADWRPYSYGRWVWYPVIGWTWVPYESWGWPVYHYGRWHWRLGLGWYWIPRHHWRPAWVHWWWDRDYVGWAPLSWYNRPVLVVNNIFYDRYDDRVFSAHNRAMTVVRRGHLQAREVHRRQVGSADLERIGKVALRADQPSIRPVVDNNRPQAVAARKVLAARPGGRTEVKALAPSRTLASSRSGAGEAGRTVRARERDVSPASAGRSAAGSRADARAVRSYPSRGNAGDGRTPAPSVERRAGSDRKGDPVRVSRPASGSSGSPRSMRAPEPPKPRASGGSAQSGTAKKGEAVKSKSSSGAAKKAVSSERSSLSSRAPSSGRSYSTPRTSRSASDRSVSPPKPSGQTSGRSYSAPRSSAPSSSRSYAAPRSSRSSADRSVGPARSGGSSGSGRSSSQSRSGSSSKPSKSSSKSGSAKKKS